MTNTNYVEQLEIERVIAKKLIQDALKVKPLSVEQLIELLHNNKILNAQRLAKEIAWEMAEHKTANFNNDWLLELKD